MTTTINIFNVICFGLNEDGNTYRLMAHCVAGTSSEDAERRLKDTNSQYLSGRMFIITDEFIDEHPQVAKMFYTGYTDDPAMTKQEVDKWIKRSLNPQYFGDGEYGPAPFREFFK